MEERKAVLDERAKWITIGSTPDVMSGNLDKINGSVYFRKEFDAKDGIKEARLKICALGIGVYTINGTAVADEVLSTPYTRYDKRVIYRTYDVSKHITTGKNAIGVYVGNGFYNDNMVLWNDKLSAWKDKLKLTAVLEIVYKTGEQDFIYSDNSWRCTEGAVIYNHVRQGECCDARLRKTGFDCPDYDDADWEYAVYAHEPGGLLEAVDMPPVRIKRRLKPISFKNGVYDFGENISGRARIKVCGEPGQRIKLTYDELLNENGKPVGNCSVYAREESDLWNQDVFICSGKEEEFYPQFCYYGFRYVMAENAPKGFEIEAEVFHTDLKQIGSFESSDEMLNKIHAASVRSTLSNYMWMPTDCPHREQLGWTGDAQLSSQQVLMNFDASKAYAKWMNDFKDAQRPNGQLPGIIPSAGWGYNWGCGPSFDSALLIIPYNVYINTGSDKLIRDMWDNMILYMGYFERMSIDGIADFGLGDWMPVREPSCPRVVTDTAYLYADLTMMSEMAEIIGESSEMWKEKAETVKQAWRDRFLHDAGLEGYQTFYACAVYQGLLDGDENTKAAERLAKLVEKNDYHIDCGMLGTKYIFTVTSEYGYMDTLYKMVTNPTFPSYAYWILQGHTTLCESWDMNNSCNHHLFSEVDHWFYRYVGGIKYTKAGLVIHPLLLSAVDYIKAEHKGVAVTRNKNKINLVLPVKARVIIGDTDKMFPPGEYEFIL